ncbi:MAG: hypothetical protein HY508_09785, partial [Acidobacteria bacterium]|nr:hypothetical protein [Acidobacteriota bacterium]
MSDKPELVPFDPQSTLAPAYRSGPSFLAESGGPEGYAYLRAYWNILLKRRWTVLTVVIVLTTLVAIISFKMEPMYQAVARVEVEAETPNVQSLNDFDRPLPTNDIFIETQVEIIQTDQLAWRTIQQLRLGENPAFMSKTNLLEGNGIGRHALLQAQLIKAFYDHLFVTLVRRTRVVEVKFESSDPQLAAQVANTLVNNYIEYNFRKKYDATRQVSGWMELQLDELKAKVEKSQQALVDYERQYSIVNVSDKQNVAEQRLADLTRDLTVAQSDRLEKESLFEMVRENE